MKLTFDALEVLDAIDRRGSFAAAADELHRVPSAITYSVQQMEEALDVLLFDRRGHRAKLTEAGRELLEEGRHLLRGAAELECRVRQVAKGWEAELRIAVDTLIGMDKLFGIVTEFYASNTGTRLKFLHEVLGGTWDALASGRADLAIGASGDAPAGAAYTARPLGRVDMVLVAAPFHPLAKEPLPITEATLLRYRAVSVADSSRLLPPRTLGLLSGQDVLTVASLDAKVAAHVAGLGVGWLPRWIAEREAWAQRLVILEPEATRPASEIVVAWRPSSAGKAAKWFVKRLEDPLVAASLLS
ncbi:MAG: LysR family transcriptional regulator [Betaproteobacteria bacterium]|nr:LysR family transcriptional regulator [Betaproteobacteria bacterium]